ncbi:hypothetical protein [Haloarcula amylovorans]|uniref:hypothetical protein n=1 Tax=Haloarcula amylovorans TaxID=2562280 RepID=UPI0010769D0D|nr:hypothetical protein [Halomicroarcula amylolytica]
MSTESNSTSDRTDRSLFSPSEKRTRQGETLGYPDQPKSSDDKKPRRDNWYGNPEVETAATVHHNHGTEWSADEITDDKAESVAWEMLRAIAPKMCGASIDDPAREPTELTEPEVYPHGEGNREHLRRARINEEGGEITGGESTGVRLGDVSTERFLSIVRILLDHWDHIGHITEEVADDLYRDAQSMKSSSDKDDDEIIERLATDALQNKDFSARVDMMLSTWEKAGHITEREHTELMVEAIRLRNQPDIKDDEVIERLSDRALPLPVQN